MSEGAPLPSTTSIPPLRRYAWGARPRTQPDPGRRGLSLILTLAVILLIGITAWIQQTTTSAPVKAAGQPPLAPGSAAPPAVQISFFAKAGVKLFYVLQEEGELQPERRDLAESIVESVESQAIGPSDEVRAAIVAGDLLGPEAGLEALADWDRESIADDPDLRDDVETLRALYTDQQPEQPALDALIERHGWFGRLAATSGDPITDPAREAVVGGGAALAVALMAFGGIVICAMIAGFILLIIIGIVKASTGTLPSRFTPPLPGGSAPIEMAAIFVLGFIALKAVTGLVADRTDPKTAMYFALSAQWLLALLIFWPILRGVPRDQWLYLVGLHKGRGILREIGAGILGYLATLPILLVGALVLFGVVAVQGALQGGGSAEPEPLQNPVLEIIGGSHGPLFIILFFCLASLWAPLVEEAVFRGALYRHLRGWLHFLPAGILTALGFGLMHGYPILLLSPVISLGFGFAMIREWRGSIIACMTAHCIHNASIVALLLTILNLADV